MASGVGQLLTEVITLTAVERDFKMAPELLYDIITRQAASIEKSWLEAIMNSVDAGASKINISITGDKTIITDNGRGMSKEEILEKFEIFGAEYTDEEKESKTYGEFRMGRGQLFSHGKNTWKTGKYVMEVDIKGKGLTYTLSDSARNVDGCEIVVDTYTHINGGDLSLRIERLKSYIAFVPNVTINNKPAKDENLKEELLKMLRIETDEAEFWMTPQKDTVRVYNRGVFVKNLPYEGVGGFIISKQRLKVNFARNDIMSDCKVWNKIEKTLTQYKVKALSEAPYLNQDNKRGILKLIATDDKLFKTFQDKQIVKLANDKWISLKELRNKTVTYANLGDRVAEEVMNMNKSVVVLDRTYYNDVANALGEKVEDLNIVMKDFKEVAGDTQSVRETIDEDDYRGATQKNLAMLRIIFKDCGRDILAGKSKCFNGWTDGKTTITINMDLLKHRPSQVFMQLMFVMYHELAHDNDDGISHVHGENFYENYHTISRKYAGIIQNDVIYVKPIWEV